MRFFEQIVHCLPVSFFSLDYYRVIQLRPQIATVPNDVEQSLCKKNYSVSMKITLADKMSLSIDIWQFVVADKSPLDSKNPTVGGSHTM